MLLYSFELIGMFDLAKTEQVTEVEFKKPSAVTSLKRQDLFLSKGQNHQIYGIFNVNHPLSTIQRKIMIDAKHFYNKNEHILILYELITQTGAVSLRLLDWLVTTLAKKKELYCSRKDQSSIYEQYKLVLSRYKRRNFDPFRRCRRTVDGQSVVYCVVFNYKGNSLKSTVGQLNFVKWCIESGVHSFALRMDRRFEPSMVMPSNNLPQIGSVEQICHKIKMW